MVDPFGVESLLLVPVFQIRMLFMSSARCNEVNIICYLLMGLTESIIETFHSDVMFRWKRLITKMKIVSSLFTEVVFLCKC